MHKGATVPASPVPPAELIHRTTNIKLANRLQSPVKDNFDEEDDSDDEPEYRQIEQMHLDYDSDAFKPIREAEDVKDNPFVKMCLIAYSQHRPIAITPDLLWHYIRQAVAEHVNKNSEELRSVFVKHKRKTALNVCRKDFIRTQNNNWSSVFHEFRQLIEANLKDSAKPVICEWFTTTTQTLYDISCIALMDVVQTYFDYTLCTECGIPSVSLLGELSDWIKLSEATENLLNMFQGLPKGLDLEWWKCGLKPVLENLVRCYQYPDEPSLQDWMARIFKYNREHGSGAIAYVTGWINVFFPYIGSDEKKQNPLARISTYPKLERHIGKTVGGLSHFYEPNDTPSIWQDDYLASHFIKIELKDFGMGISQAPFTWIYQGQTLKMDFLGGPCCITEQVTEDGSAAPLGSLHVQPGWAVAYSESNI